MAQANLVKLRLRLRIFLRKSEAIFSTLDDLRLLRDFPEEDSLKIQVKKIEEKTGVFSISLYLTAVRGRSYAEGAQRDSNASPLHLLCKCGVPARGGVRLI